MSTSSTSILPEISQKLTIYLGFSLFVAGLIGGILNTIVFLSLKTFRESSCAFYLTIMSIINTFHLFPGLLTFIMINGFNIHWIDTSLAYCKFRAFYIVVCVSISLTCLCLATIDQFLATCSNHRWHQLNNIKIARWAVIGTIIGWILYGIPALLYYNLIFSTLSNKTTCVITSPIYQAYTGIGSMLLVRNLLPLTIMMIFGLLAYRNVHNIAHRTVPLVRRELDKQLTVMVLVEVFHDVLVISPITAPSIFTLLYPTPQDPFTQTLVQFITVLTFILYYFHFVSPFYIYICASKRFRQQFIYVLFTIHRNRWCLRSIVNNQIEPQA